MFFSKNQVHIRNQHVWIDYKRLKYWKKFFQIFCPPKVDKCPLFNINNQSNGHLYIVGTYFWSFSFFRTFFSMRTDQNYCQINDQHHQIMHNLCFLEENFKKNFRYPLNSISAHLTTYLGLARIFMVFHVRQMTSNDQVWCLRKN